MNRFVSDAQKKAQEKAIKRASRSDAKLLPGKGVRKQQKLDYSEDDPPEEILRAEGLSPFISDDPYLGMCPPSFLR